MKRGLFIYRLAVLPLLLILLGNCAELYAQKDRRPLRNRRARKELVQKDTIPQLSDSARAVQDSIHRADSIFKTDSIDKLSKSSLELPAFTGAQDSIIEVFTDGHRKVFYYGNVTAEYGDIKLTADYMEFDLETKVLFARGTKDTAGVINGAPVMETEGNRYEMEEVRYNFESRKARITNMTTQEGEGNLMGKNIKMMDDKSINLTKGKYTVCDADHPHYYLNLSAAKVMTDPQNIVFGPANPVIEDVPIPLGLPFGFIPKMPDRATGILMPTFGEEDTRGFYLKDIGMYFVLGQYFDISLTGSLYTLGSWAVDVNSRYKVNYKFNGNFGFTYSNDQGGEKGTDEFFQYKNMTLKWSHSQDSKAHPGSTFSASVNFSTPSSNRFNSRSVTEALQSQTSSSISYTRNWDGKLNLSANILHSQNTADSSYVFTLPNLTFSVSRIYPFKRKHRVGKEKLYEKISFGYNTAFQNKMNFKISDFQQTGPDAPSPIQAIFKNAQSGMSNNFQIGLPSFDLFKYINCSPGINYSMNVFFQKTDKSAVEVEDPTTGLKTVVVQSTKGDPFSHFGMTHDYSASFAMSTRLYGLFNLGIHHKVQAIRHVISPSLSATYSPEKGTAFNGWRTLTYVDEKGQTQTLDYNIYEKQMNSYPQKGQNGSLNLSIVNNLEAKVRDLRDTTGTGSKKVKLIDQLNLNTGYNFLADSLKLRDLTLTMTTNVLEKIGINASAKFEPYAIGSKGNVINRFSIQEGGPLMRFTQASVSLSYSLKGEGKTDGSTGKKTSGAAQDYTRVYYHPVTGEYIPGGYLYYMNTNAPWSVNLNYNFSYNKLYQFVNGKITGVDKFAQLLGISGNVKLTPKMSINLTTGFDLMTMQMTTTQLAATYDLHCFNISFSWVPSGKWQSYSFRIAANASALADLLQFKKQTSYWDNAF